MRKLLPHHSAFLVAVALFCCFCLAPAQGAGNYDSGIQAYKSGHYTLALPYLQRAVQERPQDSYALFYLGLCQARLQHYNDAQQAFEEVTHRVDTRNDLAVRARRNISFITQSQVAVQHKNQSARIVLAAATRQEDNYLSAAIAHGNVVHWNLQKMPLKVYIRDGRSIAGWRPEMKSLVTHAMGVWQNASLNKIRMIQTIHPDNADIIVNWKDSFHHAKVGENPFEAYGDMIIRSDITIAMYSAINHQPLAMAEMQKVILHELGHALGIQGHSPYPEDIMYYVVNPSQTLPADNPLTSRDKKTLLLLYKMTPDIKNSSNLSISASKDYSKSARLGYKYLQSQDYNRALRYFQEALRIKQDDAGLYGGMGYACQKTGNVADAIQFYRKSIELDNQQFNSKYNLAGLLINHGVNLTKNKSFDLAKQDFQESIVLYTDVLKYPKAPQDTVENLTIARKNLSLIP